MNRLAFALPIIREAEPEAIISIDTFHASIARRTVEEFGMQRKFQEVSESLIYD